MGVTGTDVHAAMALHSLKSDPDVRLRVLHDMPDMQGCVSVG